MHNLGYVVRETLAHLEGRLWPRTSGTGEGGSNLLLLETGDYILLETGDNLILENA